MLYLGVFMKRIFKKFTSALVALMLVLGAMPAINLGICKKQSWAESQTGVITSYGAQLKGKEVDFYNAIATMYVNNMFLSLGSYNLVSNNVVSANDIDEYAKGNNVLISAFNNAKDAYMLDHPELFYVDFSKLSLSIGVSQGNYVASIDYGKHNDYIDAKYTASSAAAAVQTIASQNGYLKFMPTAATDSKDKVLQVARNISGKVTPSENDANNDIFTTTNGTANAEGYAKTFKYCMDKLNIPCFVVKGFYSGELFDAPARHFWNYVQLDGKWFVVDTYLNDVSSNEDLLLVRAEKLTRHMVQTNTYSYKEFALPTVESFKIEKSYTKNNMLVNVLYNGMNPAQLLYFKELYIVQVLTESSDSVSAKAVFADTMQTSKLVIDNNVSSVTYAVTATAPDDGTNYAELSKADIIVMETFENEVKASSWDNLRPIAQTMTTSVVGDNNGKVYNNNEAINGQEALHIVINYDNNLKQNGSSVNIIAKLEGFEVSSVVSNVVWNSALPKVVEFDFKPFDVYAEGEVTFSFEIDGLVSAGINNDETLARPAYIKVDYPNRAFDFASQNTNVWKERQAPYLESGFNLKNIVLKDGMLQTVSVKPENLMLVSNNMKGNIKNIVSGQGEEYFYNLELVANGKAVSLADGYVNVVLPFEGQKTYEDLKTKDINVFVYDENGTNEQEVDAMVTKYGIVVSTNKLGNFKVVYGGEKTTTAKKVYIKIDNGFGSASLVIDSSFIFETNNDLTINLMPNSGYDVDYVILNGKNISSRVLNNKINLNKTELEADNIIQIGFISGQRKLLFAQNGYESLDDEFAANQQLEFVAEEIPKPEPEPKSKTGLLLIIVGAWVVVCGLVVLAIVLIKKKSNKKLADEKQE